MKRARRLWTVGWVTLLALALALMLLTIIARTLPRPPLSSFAPSSVAVYDGSGRLLRLTLASDEQYRLWTPLSHTSPEFVQALLLHEDQYFRWHLGVNPAALIRAALRTASGGTRQGGSTVTMQLARLLYHLNTRSISGKLTQIVAATWLELRYSKDEILEAHLNLVPFGRNIEGVGAASLIYFDKRADQLTLDEALTLALIPQSPHARDPDTHETASLKAARLRLAERWTSTHPNSHATVSPDLHYANLRQLPFEAPHLVNSLIAESGARTEIHSTVDLPLQHLLERTVHQYVSSHQRIGVDNAVAMLLDDRTMEVKALVGSADFFDSSIAGQVNGAFAKRSPGSALKPFIYALAIDQGLIHPYSVLKDAPTAFGPYSPENFDGAFVGPITAHDALIRSRNVPAVTLAAHLAEPDLYEFLQSAGVSRLASEQHYGLALALGGGETTMEELVTLYAMLGNRGMLKPPRYTPEAPVTEGTRLLSDEASFMVLSILRDNPRPDGLQPGTPAIAWKTGTSWGFRDAWSIGLVGPYVLAVWVGNFDGRGNPAFVGSQIAAPLFFTIADGLRASLPPMPDPLDRVPSGVRRVEVCAASGDLPNADCPHTVPTWFIPGRSPIRLSTVHRKLIVDTRTGLQACPDTPTRFRRTEVFEYWPSDIQHLFAQAGMPRRRPPPSPRCTATEAPTVSPTITSPVAGATYEFRVAKLGADAITLNATASPDVHAVYWFVDNAFLGEAPPSSVMSWNPTRSGEFALSVVDDHGGSTTRRVRVALVP